MRSGGQQVLRIPSGTTELWANSGDSTVEVRNPVEDQIRPRQGYRAGRPPEPHEPIRGVLEQHDVGMCKELDRVAGHQLAVVPLHSRAHDAGAVEKVQLAPVGGPGGPGTA